MRIYSVKGPDGRIYDIQGPDGASQEQVIAALQQQLGATAPPEELAAPPRAGSRLGDLATAFKQGAVGSAKALTDVFGAQNAASASLDTTANELQKDYSAARQAELQAQAARMKAAEASGSTWEEIKAGAKNIVEAPLQATAQGLGSLVPYVPTMFFAPLAGALRLARPTVAALEAISNAAPKVLGTAQGMGTVKGAVYDAVLQKETEAGVAPEVAKQKAIAAQDYFGKNADQIALGGVLGRVAGGSGVESLLTKPGAAAAAQGLTRRVLTAAGEEFITEAPQGGQERLAANLAQQRAGYDVPTMQGVIGAGLQEGLTGALTAGPVGALRGPQVQTQTEAPPPAPPVQPPQDLLRLGYDQGMAAPEPRPPIREVTPTPPPPQTVGLQQTMVQHDQLVSQLEPLLMQYAAAAQQQDTDTIRILSPQIQTLQNKIEQSANLINQLGGTTVSPEELETKHQAALTNLDNKIAAAHKKLVEAANPQSPDFNAGEKHAQTLDTLKKQREQQIQDYTQRQGALAVKQDNLVSMTQRGQTRDLFTNKKRPYPKRHKPRSPSICRSKALP